MEAPFVGKRADMLNKKAVVAFFHKRHDDARRLWEEALRCANEMHVDAQTNLTIYKWSLGQISD